MEYVLSAVAIVQLGVISVAIWLMTKMAVMYSTTVSELIVSHSEDVRTILAAAASERSDLEDRMMALSQPDQLTLFKAHEDAEELKAEYVDELKEVELTRSSNGDSEQTID